MVPCTSWSSLGWAVAMTTYGSLHFLVKIWLGSGNDNLWFLALPSQDLVGQWQRQLMVPCTSWSSFGWAVAMTTYGSLHFLVKSWLGSGNDNLWFLALPGQVLVGQWQRQLMVPCTSWSSLGWAVAMTTYGSLHFLVKFWLGSGNDNLWFLALPGQVLVGQWQRQLMVPCTSQSRFGWAVAMTTYGSLHFLVKIWLGSGNDNLWFLALPSQDLVGQWQRQLMVPCTSWSSLGWAVAMTTYGSLHFPVKSWLGSGNDNLWFLALGQGLVGQ